MRVSSPLPVPEPPAESRDMDNERFLGNIYIHLPCHVADAGSAKVLKAREAEPQHGLPATFMAEMDARLASEISNQMKKDLSRACIGEFQFVCHDQEETPDSEQIVRPGVAFVAIHQHTGLAVVTIVFHGIELPASQLLDQVSKEEILYCRSSGASAPGNFEVLLAEEYGLIKTGTSRACLSATREHKPRDDVARYYLAGETYRSQNMGAALKPGAFLDQIGQDVGQYDSSEIYVGKNNILRIDTRANNGAEVPAVFSDAALLFIIELILFQDAAVSRTNTRVVQKIGHEERVPMKFLEDCSNEFGRTMAFWNIRVFRFITAQTLADIIAARFETRADLAAYRENQRFLEHKINIRYALASEAENRVLNTIAVLLFVFEAVPALYRAGLMALSQQPLEPEQILAGTGSSGLVALLLVILIRFLRVRKSRAATAT
ncbi:hypothetical protein [Kineobactrum salinum]|uniref:Uncharacterized protein n=1 Tax=Kineobactrum salinum TaxID=2708301 RepID=A0A6C0U439_9GAMM|nr:hypothetical protein [Kineobactrum salinum]QIB66910.1 hypothetical protein G3T16_17455 [Kineobactrum salinum]